MLACPLSINAHLTNANNVAYQRFSYVVGLLNCSWLLNLVSKHKKKSRSRSPHIKLKKSLKLLAKSGNNSRKQSLVIQGTVSMNWSRFHSIKYQLSILFQYNICENQLSFCKINLKVNESHFNIVHSKGSKKFFTNIFHSTA